MSATAQHGPWSAWSALPALWGADAPRPRGAAAAAAAKASPSRDVGGGGGAGGGSSGDGEMLLILRGDGSISYVSEGLARSLPGGDGPAAALPLIDDALLVEHRSFWDLVLERFSSFEFIDDVEATLLTREGQRPVIVNANLAPIGDDGTFAVVLRLRRRPELAPDDAAPGSEDDHRHEHEELLRLANIGRTSRTLVHEVLNPLTVIMGCLDLVDGRMRGPGPVDLNQLHDLHARMRRAADHIARVSRGVSRLATARGGGTAPVHTPVADAIDTVLDWYDEDLGLHGIGVQRTDEQADAAVACPRHVVVQVLTNLLMNARDALILSEGLQDRRIELHAKRVGSFVEIAVTDNASAPAPGVAKRQGFGIGLRVCRELLAAYGGYLLRHTGRRPTRFVIVLPVVR